VRHTFLKGVRAAFYEMRFFDEMRSEDVPLPSEAGEGYGEAKQIAKKCAHKKAPLKK
jgi:hypothetical protein